MLPSQPLSGSVLGKGAVMMVTLDQFIRRWNSIRPLALALVAAAVVSACGIEQEDPGGEQKYAPVETWEFDAVTSPSIEQFVAAYESVYRLHPDAATNNTALSRLLFDGIKEMAPTASADAEHTLSRNEYRFAIANPRSAYAAFTVAPIAEAAAIYAFPCAAQSSYVNDKADATRHAYWMALTTSRLGSGFALAIGLAHEADAADSVASRMDLHNNVAGIRLATSHPGSSDQELLQLVMAQVTRAVLYSDVDATPADVLVYYLGAQPFDGGMTGAWIDGLEGAGNSADVTLNITQCDSVIRGQLAQQSGASTLRRRFHGSILDGGRVDIVFDDPRPSEAGVFRADCMAMRARLSGDATALAGSWSSSTCGGGGSLTLARTSAGS
jgi:hypothetical protein